jgi:hypothetical protein
LFDIVIKNISLIRDVTIADEGLQNLGLSSALRTFGKGGGVFIVPPCHDMEPRFPDQVRRTPLQFPLTTRKGMLMTYSYPNPHGNLFESTHLEHKIMDDFVFITRDE